MVDTRLGYHSHEQLRFGRFVPLRGIYALAVDGSNIYAGGHIVGAGGIAANKLARWDGNSWSALGSGIDWCSRRLLNVRAIAVSRSDVYVGDYFQLAGNIPASGIAKGKTHIAIFRDGMCFQPKHPDSLRRGINARKPAQFLSGLS